MAAIVKRWKVCWFLVVVSSLDYFAHGTETVRESKMLRRVETSTVSAGDSRHSEGQASAITRAENEKKQRLCLNRLRDALKSVCTGSDRVPHYFNPGQVFRVNQTKTTHGVQQRRSKNQKRDVPTTTQPLRNLLRRRSRRNIVRECCDKPCSLSNLTKYCSPLLRFHSPVVEPAGSKNIPVRRGHLQIMKPNGALKTASLTLQDEPSCTPGECNDDMNNFRTSQSTQLCFSREDLQSLFLKLLNKQMNKKDNTTASTNHDSDMITNDISSAHLSPSSDFLSTMTANAYAIATNKMTPYDSRIDQINSLKLKPTNSQPMSTVLPTNDEELEEENEIARVAEPAPQSRPKSSNNAGTVKPIPEYINLPKGTNDYLY